ncbi:MFS transporter [Spongiactinospora sp. TRM90649]|uniref:MFS transporter n=1 Tax=Spongiactinospora sp. TRM90649 TaxID=3031114 RepID=UPI0023F61D67|nr:MFS transporter [Spongiactinospora sp. TRM90649]MDF5755503.1 MFS transporter [Spongiactinospora sp. TRM90649]
MRRLSGSAFPSVKGHRKVLVAAAIDAFGVGAFYPLSFLYLLRQTDLSAGTVGLAVTAGTLLALPFGPVGGMLADRFGSRWPLAGGNVIVAAGYSLFLIADTFPAVLLTAFLIMLADRLYWASWPVYVARVAGRDRLDAWYALVAMLKNGGIGLGALFASIALVLDPQAGRLLLLINVITSLFAAALIGTHRTAPTERAPAAPEDTTSGRPAATWRAVLRDRGFAGFCLAFTALSFGWMLPTVALPAYLVNAAGLPGWLPSAAFAINCVVVFAAQQYVTHAVRRLRRTRLLVAAAALFLLSVTLLVAAPGAAGAVTVALALSSVLAVTAAELISGPAAGALVAASAPPHAIGRYNAVYQLTWTVSAAAGPGLIGLLIDAGGVALWTGFAVLLVIGAAGVLWSESRLSPEATRAPLIQVSG